MAAFPISPPPRHLDIDDMALSSTKILLGRAFVVPGKVYKAFLFDLARKLYPHLKKLLYSPHHFNANLWTVPNLDPQKKPGSSSQEIFPELKINNSTQLEALKTIQTFPNFLPN